MRYVWVVLSCIDGNLSVEDKIRTLEALEKLRVSLGSDKILFSFNSFLEIEELDRDYEKLDLSENFEKGPIFGNEGVLIDRNILGKDELYFLNKGEKVIWYLNNYSKDIETIVFVDKCMFIEGISLCLKLKNKDIKLFLAHSNPNFTSIIKGLNIDNEFSVEVSNDSTLLETINMIIEQVERESYGQIRNRIKIGKQK